MYKRQPLCWYNKLDGRGDRDIDTSVKEAVELMRWHAERGIPVEANEPHHWGLRDAHDVIPVVMALSLIHIFALGVVVQGICVLTGTLIFRKKGDPLNGINRYGTGYSNAGFIGIPLVQASLGSTGVFLLVGFLAASGIFMWTNGAKEVSNGRYKINLKKALINPSNIGAAIGFLLRCV